MRRVETTSARDDFVPCQSPTKFPWQYNYLDLLTMEYQSSTVYRHKWITVSNFVQPFTWSQIGSSMWLWNKCHPCSGDTGSLNLTNIARLLTTYYPNIIFQSHNPSLISHLPLSILTACDDLILLRKRHAKCTQTACLMEYIPSCSIWIGSSLR